MIKYKEWFDTIKQAIKQKYKINNPEFFVDGIKLEDNELETWLKKYIDPGLLWMKYKKLEKNQFELKPFLPDPDDKVSMQLIDRFLSSLPYTQKTKWYKINYIEDYDNELIEGDSWYDLDEIRIELRYLSRIGKSKITQFKKPTETENEIVYHLFVEQDSLQNMLDDGYLVLEQLL
jgi:hypothetical protein